MATVARNTTRAIKTIVIAALGVTALSLLAFGPRPTDQLPADRVVVDYWEHWTGDEEAGMRAIVNDFNDTVGRDKHIFVRYLSTSDIEKKTLIATAAGVPPDVAGLYDQNIPQFGAQNALEPLDDMAAAHGITADKYKKVFWDECHYDGHLYGLASSAFDLALYYNTEIFQQRAESLRANGLDPNRAPRTIAELDAYAQALEQRDPDGHLVAAGFLPLEPGWYQKYFCIWFGGSWWGKTNNRFTLTDPAVIRTYEWIRSYSERLGAEAEVGFRGGLGNFDSPQNGFLSGRVAMEIQGTFLANFIRRQKPSMAGKWAAAPFPSDDPNLKDVTYCNCDVLVVPRLAKHKAEAFEFIAFVNRQDEMEKLARSHCKISPLAQVSSDFLDHHPNPYVRVFDQLAASPNAHPTEPVPVLAEVNDEMNVLAQRVSMLQSTPQQALSEMQQRLQAKYDDFVDEQRERKARGQ
jgi:ABC-type glycerol-3-phosphate transport system substrate-binding protein